MEHTHSDKCPCSNSQVQQVMMAIGEDFNAVKVELTLHYADGTSYTASVEQVIAQGEA